MTPTQLKRLRKRLGLSQQAMAERVGLETAGAWCLLEKGRRLPTKPMVLLLQSLQQLEKKSTD
jgi:transcriptional regulator with XRE-family HTH domain